MIYKVFVLVGFAAMFWAASDVLRTFRRMPQRIFWLALVILIPFGGPALWYYCQHAWPRRTRLEAEAREEKRRREEPVEAGKAERLR